MHYLAALEKLKKGSKLYLECQSNPSIFHQDLREELKNKGQKPYATIITLQTLLYMAVSPIPTPGNIGANELAFFNIFSTVFPKQFLGYAVLLYGGLVYYLILVLSGVLTIISHFQIKEKHHGLKNRAKSEI